MNLCLPVKSLETINIKCLLLVRANNVVINKLMKPALTEII